MRRDASIVALAALVSFVGLGVPADAAVKPTPAKAAAGKGAAPKISAETFARVFKKMGIEHTLEKDSEGETAVYYKNGGYNIGLFLYRGSAGELDSYQFQAGFEVENPGLEKRVADWNRTKRFARAVVRDDGVPEIRYDVSLSACGFDAQLEEEIELFQALASEFVQHIQPQ